MFIEFDGKHAGSKRRPGKIAREARKTEIKAIFSSAVQMTEIRVPRVGAIEFIGRPHSILSLPDSLLVPLEVDVVCYYDRKSKRKVINALFFNNESPPPNANIALGRYDHFYACDANTWTFAETGKFSVCVVLRGDLGEIYNDKRGAQIKQECTITISGQTEGNPELGAARELILALQERLSPLPPKPIGIIMDSELGLLKDINARRSPLVDDFFLPAGFEIMYASDATGTTEFMCNMLIRMCDKASTDFLRAHEKANGLRRV